MRTLLSWTSSPLKGNTAEKKNAKLRLHEPSETHNFESKHEDVCSIKDGFSHQIERVCKDGVWHSESEFSCTFMQT